MSLIDDITQLLIKWQDGDREAFDKVVTLTYNELYSIAVGKLKDENNHCSLQATELINEAYIRLVNWQNIEWKSRVHFFAISAQVMRNILVDYARKKAADKRGQRYKLSLSQIANLPKEPDLDLLELNDALVNLATFDPVQSRIVELRYFGGLTLEEIAEVMKLPLIKVRRQWDIAKLWLLRELDKTKK